MTLLEEFYRENYPIVLGYLFSLFESNPVYQTV